MNKQFLLLVILCLLPGMSYAQALFQKGYFINNQDQRIDCLINNKDWVNNPITFDYKLSENGDTQEAIVETVKEFAVGRYLKYRRATVAIDRSGNDLEHLTINRQPDYQEETLFLRVLLEGKASLYQYESGNLIRFFFQHENADIEQLIFKYYLEKDSKIAAENSYYKYQLLNSLVCDDIAIKTINTTSYNAPELRSLFQQYNTCSNSDYTIYKKPLNDLFHFSIRPGIGATSLDIESWLSSFNLDYEIVPAYSIGIESRITLPFKNGRWSVTIEPVYRQFNIKQTEQRSAAFSNAVVVATVDYRSLEVPFGLRRDFFLNEQSTLFAHIVYSYNIPVQTAINFTRVSPSVLSTDLEVSHSTNFSYGIGYLYKAKWTVEMMYLDRRPLFVYTSWRSQASFLSLIVGYTF